MDLVRRFGTGGLRSQVACARRVAVGVLAAWACAATAQTYTSASTAFSFIDSSSHSKVGYATTPYKLNASSGCGTTPPVLDDTLSDAIPIGFNFKFGATTYASAYIMSNGRLQFGNTTCGAGTSAIGPPQTYPYGYPAAGMNATMKIFGVDLDPTNRVDKPNYPSSSAQTPCLSSATCYISQATIGSAPSRQFVVTWKSVPEWVSASNTSGSFDLQIILNEDGSFIFQYGTISHGGTGTAQVGWQLSTTDYQVLSFGASAEPPPNTAIVFYIPAPIAAYRFDEGAWAPGVAGQVVDSSGNARHGSVVGAAQATAGGKVCRGANIPLNTSGAQVDAVRLVDMSTAGLNLIGSGTIAFWYLANAAWGTGTPAQLVDATATSGEWFYLTRTGAGTLYFGVRDSTGVLRSVETPVQSVAAGTWVHIAIAWSFNGLSGSNQDNLRIFINGGTPTVASFTSSGTVTTQAGPIYLGDNPLGVADVRGTVNSADGVVDEAQVYNYVLSTAQVGVLQSATRSCTPLAFDHFEIQHGSGTGVTCTSSTLTVRACTDAACSSLYTGGVAAMFTTSGGPPTNFDSATGNGSGAAFVLPVGSGSTTKGVQVIAPGSTRLGTSGGTVTAPGATRCNFGSPSCTFTAADSGFVFNVPDHVSDTAQAVTLSALRKSDNALVCVPAFANVSKTVGFVCAYQNPTSGTLPARLNGNALNAANNPAAACDASGRSASLAFNASGVASTTVQYADVGQLQLTATYIGSGTDAGLVMTGADAFIAAPAAFAISGVTAGPIKAGNGFAATVTARNSSGVATPNFGRELSPQGVTLSLVRAQPTGAGASNGVFTGSLGAFSGGVASASNLVWSEVGKADLTAVLTGGNYLGSGLTATGTTGSAGAVGRFIPHHFDVAVTPACSSFSYAAQPFTVKVTAKNGLATPGTTLNYDGSSNTAPNFAQAVVLSDAAALGVGSFGGTGAVAASLFSAGLATTTAPAYTYTTKLTLEKTLAVRAIDVDAVSSSGYAEGSTVLRSGRLRVSNAFGSERSALQLTVQAQYWSGNTWVPNSADSCSVLPAAAVARSGYTDYRGAPTAAWSTTASAINLIGGSGTLTLSAPTPTATGSVDLALNLGASAADQSCLAVHPASTGAALPWLRSLQGNCASAWNSDPAARASFGIYAPETRKTLHVREIF